MFTSLCRPTCAADSVYSLYTRCTLFTVNILFLSIAQLYVELNVNPDTCHSASTCSAFDSAEARVTYTLSYRSIRLSHLLKHFKLSLFKILSPAPPFSAVLTANDTHSPRYLPRVINVCVASDRCFGVGVNSHLDEKGEGRERKRKNMKATQLNNNCTHAHTSLSTHARARAHGIIRTHARCRTLTTS